MSERALEVARNLERAERFLREAIDHPDLLDRIDPDGTVVLSPEWDGKEQQGNE